MNKAVRELTTREQELINLLWDYLKREPGKKELRKTGYGTKTKVGLANTIAWIMDQRKEA